MEKISHTVYPTEPLDINTWYKEFKIGILANKPNNQAKDMMSLWKDSEGNRNSFENALKLLNESCLKN